MPASHLRSPRLICPATAKHWLRCAPAATSREAIACQDGRCDCFETIKAPFHGPGNSLRSVVDISRNITEQRNMQVALNYASFQAGLAEMSTTLLHNIGNAINVVIENSYQLRHGCGQLEQVAAAPEATAASAALTAQTVQREAARVVLRRRLAQSVQPRTYRDD